METQERSEGPTPNGGAYAIAYWHAADGSPTDKANAVTCEIVEYNANGEDIFRTYGRLTGEESAQELQVPPLSDLADFDRKLRGLRAAALAGRPFLCDGSPIGCDVFLVGTNPGTDIPFWPHWSAERGCDKEAWLREYLKVRQRYGPTRKRIEILCEMLRSVRVLETNIFSMPSKREAGLDRIHRTTEVFEFLLESLRPRVLFVHGRSAVQHLERLTKTAFPHGEFVAVEYAGSRFEVITGNHLSYHWKDAEVERLGRRLGDRIE